MIAEVIVDILSSNVDKIYDYIMPEHSTITVGSRVLVSFANRNIEGYVISVKDTSSYDNHKLKTIIKSLDAQPVLNPRMVELSFFMKEKFHLRHADTLRLCLPPQVRSTMTVKQKRNVKLSNTADISALRKNALAQIGIVQYLTDKASEDIVVLNDKFGSSAVKKLLEMNFVEIEEQEVFSKFNNALTLEEKKFELNDGQKMAISSILASQDTFLLHGVTGSGKTEVYMRCISKVIAEGKTAIMLVPEISLTPQMLGRFRNRFGDNVAILHSMLSPRQRYDEWYRLKTGKAKIALGARSCIFAPLDNVGIIIIDEEHDQSYYSENNPRFFTHEVARFLSSIHHCPLVLGSATPSIESYYKAKTNEYKLLELPKRANDKDLPKVQIVDMLSEIQNGNSGIFSVAFLDALSECVSNNKQAMIFINRRGFSSFMMCKECGYVPKCEDCDVSLVYHKEDDLLKCHYCGKKYRALTKCPQCGSESIRFGAVGTQRVVEELRKLFPQVTILRLDNDSTASQGSYIEILEKFNNTTPAILVGTQMIAKGHDFGQVTLVGIIDADLSLHFSDFRATERTYQLITQVSGRAGRSKDEGKIILQTYYPKHYVYRCAANYDYARFYAKEINLRETSHFPPFSKILRVLISSESDGLAYETTRDIYDKVKAIKKDYYYDFIFLQAMKCPKKRIQNKYRYEVLMRYLTTNEENITARVYASVVNNYKNVNVFIESNPQNLS